MLRYMYIACLVLLTFALPASPSVDASRRNPQCHENSFRPKADPDKAFTLTVRAVPPRPPLQPAQCSIICCHNDPTDATIGVKVSVSSSPSQRPSGFLAHTLIRGHITSQICAEDGQVCILPALTRASVCCFSVHRVAWSAQRLIAG